MSLTLVPSQAKTSFPLRRTQEDGPVLRPVLVVSRSASARVQAPQPAELPQAELPAAPVINIADFRGPSCAASSPRYPAIQERTDALRVRRMLVLAAVTPPMTWLVALLFHVR